MVSLSLRRFVNACLDVLFPPPERCLLCGRVLRDRQAICSDCLVEIAHPAGVRCARCGRTIVGYRGTSSVPPLGCPFCQGKQWSFSQARSIGPYAGALRLGVHRLKFRGKQELGRALGELLARSLDQAWWEAVDYIVPVPLHPERRQQRGFNQAEIIAEQLSLSTGKPMRSLLLRQVATHPQSGLSQPERQRNVQGAFCLAKSQERYVRGRRLLLVDDVLTTGSTLDACSRVLLQAGATEVRVATLAVTDPKH